jgi:clan AA aspartic protease
MISGRVENRQALVPITYRLPGQPDLILEHIVDTGFTGELTLPPAAITAMELLFAYDEDIKLANDSREQVPVHIATILWHGQDLAVRVFATGRRPLFGTALMDRKELVIQFADNGLVTIDDL